MLEDRVAELRSAVYDLQVRILGTKAILDRQPFLKAIWGKLALHGFTKIAAFRKSGMTLKLLFNFFLFSRVSLFFLSIYRHMFRDYVHMSKFLLQVSKHRH